MVAGRRRKKVPSKKIIAPLFLLSKRKRAVNGVEDFFDFLYLYKFATKFEDVVLSNADFYIKHLETFSYEHS